MTDWATLIGAGALGSAFTLVGSWFNSRTQLKIKDAEIEDLREQRSERARELRRARYAALNRELDRVESLGRGGSKILGLLHVDELEALRDGLAAVESDTTPDAAVTAATLRNAHAFRHVWRCPDRRRVDDCSRGLLRGYPSRS